MPNGVNFGPGFVGENEALVQQEYFCNEKQKSPGNNFISGNQSGSNSSITKTYQQQVGKDMESSKASYQRDLISAKSNIGGNKPMPSFQVRSTPVVHSDFNGFNGGSNFGFNHPSQTGMVELATATPYLNPNPNGNGNRGIGSIPASNCDSSMLHYANPLGVGSSSNTAAAFLGNQGNSSWHGVSAFNKQDLHSFPPPDLNVRFLAPSSPISSVQIGSPQQPDLALQL